MMDKCKLVVDIVVTLVRNKYSSNDAIEEKELDECITQASSFIEDGLSDIEIENIRKELHHRFLVRMNRGIKIVNTSEYKDWYNPFDIKSANSYWDRYKTYLLLGLSFPERVIDTIDNSTTDIVNLLGKPIENSCFSRKGLVIGDVQSGKTANYISVINKAADAGYKVIVLLTGTIEKLRQQTQARIDDGFIGIDTSAWERGDRNKSVGVGLINAGIEVMSFTSVIKDFNRSILRSSNVPLNTLPAPLILVAKKNKAVLKSIYNWFNREKKDTTSNRINQSLLFIDDEADNASINTNSQENDPTSINKCIRDILGLFMRSSYVGYTATPYANVFIEPNTEEDMENEDLFPKDYIYVLQPPDNYIGAREIYSENGRYKTMYREIDDFEEFLPVKHKKDYELPLDIPVSLKKAILSFLIINAIRDLRGDLTTHRSMLINVSRLVLIQDNLRELVSDFFSSVKNVVQNYILDTNPDRYPLLKLLKQTYDTEFLVNGEFKEDDKINWEQIRAQLFDSIKTIKVESVNGGNASKLLDYKGYEKGLRIIAIGGLSLSRGLTLEGLCVSYLYRNSIMYDTLMQMGRWFGYRRNYEDLCQIWMTEESYSWYQHISDATDELRSEIKKIYYSNQTPKDVGIKVRSSEGSLIITAKNKMRSAGDFICDINLNANYLETVYFSKDRQVIKENIEQVKKFLGILKDNGYYVSNPDENELYNKATKQILNVDKSFIVGLLKHIQTHYIDYKFDANKIAQLIEASNESILDKWDVAFPKGKSQKSFSILDEKIQVVGRTMMEFPGGAIGFRKKRLGTPGVVSSGLTVSEYRQFETFLENQNPPFDYSDKVISDDLFFSNGFKRKPLLVIYLVDPNFTNHISNDEVLVGLAIGIPQLKEPKGLQYTYKVNLRWAAEHFGVDEDEVDEIGEIDD